MADRKKKFAAEKKRIEEEIEEVKQSNEVRASKKYCLLWTKAICFVQKLLFAC